MMTDTPMTAVAAGTELRHARDLEQRARVRARDVALRELAAGQSEVAVAKELGVDRMTVRKWRRESGQ